MRIGIMLRHYEQDEGGVKVYTKNLLPHLFSMGSKHQYVLIYQNPSLIGTYATYPNVEEIVLRAPGKVLWDQIVGWWINKKNIDLIFNPKFTVPFLSKAKKVFVFHGSEWFVIPKTFVWYDRWYTKIFTPLYFRYSDAFITVSHTVKKDALRFTNVDPNKVFPVYNGFDKERFRIIDDRSRLKAVKEKYQLPDRFILWVGQHDPRKNVGRLFRALALLKENIDHKLVIAGEQRGWVKGEIRLLDRLRIRDRVQFAGWVFHDDLPAFYNLAELFVLPSLYEGFGIPLIEAMACGCPVLTSKTCSPPEVVDEAGYLVDPLNVDDIAEGIRELLANRDRRREMIEKGLQRVKSFGWEKCAEETLSVLEIANLDRNN